MRYDIVLNVASCEDERLIKIQFPGDLELTMVMLTYNSVSGRLQFRAAVYLDEKRLKVPPLRRRKLVADDSGRKPQRAGWSRDPLLAHLCLRQNCIAYDKRLD